MIIDSIKYNGKCSCGREHVMETKLSVIEAGCLKDIDTYLSRFELRGYTVAVYDDNTYRATQDRHPKADLEVILNPENLHANEHGVDALMAELPEGAELLLAIGAGTVHDITRYCAYQRGIPFVSCPTAASVDGFCSSVAAMTWHGCKKTLTAVAPTIVLADTDIIKNAPIRLARSGIGDLIGKYVALSDWRIANAITGEFICERIYDMTLSATEAVLRTADGILSGDVSFYENLMYGLLLSGLAMQMMGNSRPASGAEHHISHIIEMAPASLGVSSDALHGEKVGVGTLMALSEYKKIAEKCNPVQDYSPYSDEYILSVFGTGMAKEILEENVNDAARGITADMLRAAMPKIREIISALPSPEALGEVYVRLGMNSSLADIGVDEGIAEALIINSPLVRSRLTLMRLRKCFM